MTETKKPLDGKTILEWTEQEWNDFRQNAWNKKREYYNRDMPENYLGNRKIFASFIDRSNKKRRKQQ